MNTIERTSNMVLTYITGMEACPKSLASPSHRRVIEGIVACGLAVFFIVAAPRAQLALGEDAATARSAGITRAATGALDNHSLVEQLKELRREVRSREQRARLSFGKGHAAALYRMKIVQIDELLQRLEHGKKVSTDEIDRLIKSTESLVEHR